MKFLLKWWWPSYALIFPLIFLPTKESGVASDFTFRFLLNIIAIVGGFILELLAHPSAKLTDVKTIPSFLRKNPAVIFALLYGIWIFTSGLFSSNPERALTGTSTSVTFLPISAGGSIWEISFIFVFVLIYLRSVNDSTQQALVIKSVFISCVAVSMLAVVEIIIKHSIFTGIDNAEGQLPFATFPGRGHLAGFLCIGFGLIIYLVKQNKYYQLPGYLICFVIGATQNRSSLVVLIIILFFLVFNEIKAKFLVIFISLVAFSAGFVTSQEILYKNQTIVFRTQGDLSSGRSIIWKSAVNGIIKKPVFGWGGEIFQSYWANQLTKEDLIAFFKLSGYGGEYHKHSDTLFILKDENQKLIYKNMIGWSSHNGFFDRSLSYGVIGSLIYLIILLYAIKASWKAGFAMAIIAYQVFLLAWFSVDAAHGTYWSLLAIACVAFRQPMQRE